MRLLRRLVSALGVDRVEQRLAGQVAPDVLDDELVEEAQRVAGRVRRDDDVRGVPPRAVGRERLLAEDIEDGARETARAQRLEQRRLVDQRAA